VKKELDPTWFFVIVVFTICPVQAEKRDSRSLAGWKPLRKDHEVLGKISYAADFLAVHLQNVGGIQSWRQANLKLGMCTYRILVPAIRSRTCALLRTAAEPAVAGTSRKSEAIFTIVRFRSETLDSPLALEVLNQDLQLRSCGFQMEFAWTRPPPCHNA